MRRNITAKIRSDPGVLPKLSTAYALILLPCALICTSAPHAAPLRATLTSCTVRLRTAKKYWDPLRRRSWWKVEFALLCFDALRWRKLATANGTANPMICLHGAGLWVVLDLVLDWVSRPTPMTESPIERSQLVQNPNCVTVWRGFRNYSQSTCSGTTPLSRLSRRAPIVSTKKKGNVGRLPENQHTRQAITFQIQIAHSNRKPYILPVVGVVGVIVLILLLLLLLLFSPTMTYLTPYSKGHNSYR